MSLCSMVQLLCCMLAKRSFQNTEQSYALPLYSQKKKRSFCKKIAISFGNIQYLCRTEPCFHKIVGARPKFLPLSAPFTEIFTTFVPSFI